MKMVAMSGDLLAANSGYLMAVMSVAHLGKQLVGLMVACLAVKSVEYLGKQLVGLMVACLGVLSVEQRELWLGQQLVVAKAAH